MAFPGLFGPRGPTSLAVGCDRQLGLSLNGAFPPRSASWGCMKWWRQRPKRVEVGAARPLKAQALSSPSVTSTPVYWSKQVLSPAQSQGWGNRPLLWLWEVVKSGCGEASVQGWKERSDSLGKRLQSTYHTILKKFKNSSGLCTYTETIIMPNTFISFCARLKILFGLEKIFKYWISPTVNIFHHNRLAVPPHQFELVRFTAYVSGKENFFNLVPGCQTDCQICASD